MGMETTGADDTVSFFGKTVFCAKGASVAGLINGYSVPKDTGRPFVQNFDLVSILLAVEGFLEPMVAANRFEKCLSGILIGTSA